MKWAEMIPAKAMHAMLHSRPTLFRRSKEQLLPRECSMSSQKHNVSRHAYLPQAEDFVKCVAE